MLHVCSFDGARSTMTDWAGASEGNSSGCVTPNPYTSNCSCPSATTPIDLDTTVGSEARRLEFCASSSATATFGGAYEVDNQTCAAQSTCKGNPLAGGTCACPNGFTPLSFATNRACEASTVQATIVLCYR
jgi:hypothetical protein